jgi:hypothetical protein
MNSPGFSGAAGYKLPIDERILADMNFAASNSCSSTVSVFTKIVAKQPDVYRTTNSPHPKATRFVC